MPRLLTESGALLEGEGGGHLLTEDGDPGDILASPFLAPYYSGGVPPDAIRAVLLGPSAKITRRCELLNYDGSPWMSSDEVELVSTGSVTVDISRDERRAVDCTLANDSDSLFVGVGGLWYDKLVRLWRGVDAGPLGTWETQLGTFMADKIDNDPQLGTIHITGRDLTKKLILSQTTEPLVFVAGTDALAIVRSEAAIAGIFNLILPTAGYPLVADVPFDADTTRMDIIKAVTLPFNLEVFFDAFGYMVVREFRDPFTSASEFTFQTGKTSGNLVSHVTTIDDSLLFNHIVVRGESDSTFPAQGEAIVTDPLSPIHPDRIGDRVFPYSSSLITTDAQAVTLANALLKVYALEQFSVATDSIVIPWLDGGSIADFINPDPNYAADPTRYLLQSFNIPIGTGSMTGAMGRVMTLI